MCNKVYYTLNLMQHVTMYIETQNFTFILFLIAFNTSTYM